MHTELVIAKAVTVALGVAIALQAYRGARRHGSTPMYYLAAGFVVISVAAVLESLFIDIFEWNILRAGLVQTGLVAAGMLLILYALYGGEIE
ncbi:MAG: hypothetical protein U5J98_00795 [Halobacteriales archaeon]|nr:hypothetical protein [Halobacteriales archaeon]